MGKVNSVWSAWAGSVPGLPMLSTLPWIGLVLPILETKDAPSPGVDVRNRPRSVCQIAKSSCFRCGEGCASRGDRCDGELIAHFGIDFVVDLVDTNSGISNAVNRSLLCVVTDAPRRLRIASVWRSRKWILVDIDGRGATIILPEFSRAVRSHC